MESNAELLLRSLVHDRETNLVARLVRRENRAWEMFCGEYAGPLLSLVRLRFGCSQEAAEEIVHMTFIRCVKSIQTFDPSRGRLFDWLAAIARREGCTYLRQNAAPAQRLQMDPQTCRHLEQIDQSALPETLAGRKEVRALVLQTVMALTVRQRRVLTMKYLEGRRVAEIAADLGQSEKGVESLLTRSRRAFKQLFQRRLVRINHERKVGRDE